MFLMLGLRLTKAALVNISIRYHKNVQNAVFKAAIKCNVQATWGNYFLLSLDRSMSVWARRPMLRLLTDGQPSLCVCSALHMGVCVPFFKTKKGRKKW